MPGEARIGPAAPRIRVQRINGEVGPLRYSASIDFLKREGVANQGTDRPPHLFDPGRRSRWKTAVVFTESATIAVYTGTSGFAFEEYSLWRIEQLEEQTLARGSPPLNQLDS